MIKRYSLVAVRLLFAISVGLLMTGTVHAAETAPTATGWVRYLDGPSRITPLSVAPAVNGGFVVLGTQQGQPWLGKFDVNGRPQWSHTFDDPIPFSNLESPAAIQAFPSGEILVVIQASSAKWLIKFSNQGQVIWQKALTHFKYRPIALAIRADGMIAIVNADVNVALIDGNSGELKWSKHFSAYYDRTAAPAFTKDGGLLVGLARHDSGHLIKFTADGTIVWQKPSLAGLSKILPLDNGEFVAATTYGTLFQFDGAGTTIWERRYTETQVTIRSSAFGHFDPGFNSLIRLEDGSLIAAGITTNDTATTPTTQAPESDIWVIKTDATGNLIWSRRYGRIGETNLEGTGGLLSSGSSSQPPYVAAYDSLVKLTDGLLVVGNHYEIATESSPGGPSFGLMLKLNPEGLVGIACDWALPSVAQLTVPPVRYPTTDQVPEAASASTGPVEISIAQSTISMTTACGDSLIGRPVIANAGPNFSTFYSITTTLDGSQSMDPAGGGLIYQWTQTSGPTVTLQVANTVAPSFITPNSTSQMTFELSVTDLLGGPASKDTVIVTVDKAATNRTWLPTAIRA